MQFTVNIVSDNSENLFDAFSYKDGYILRLDLAAEKMALKCVTHERILRVWVNRDISCFLNVFVPSYHVLITGTLLDENKIQRKVHNWRKATR